MEQINRIEVRGNVGNIRIFNNEDSQMASFSVVTNYLYKGRGGDAVVETMWFNVVAWTGKQTLRDFNELKKGMQVHVIGRMRDREYSGADGGIRHVTEIVAAKVAIVEDTAPENA